MIKNIYAFISAFIQILKNKILDLVEKSYSF